MADKPAADKSWTEPASSANTQYPFNDVKYTRSGHFFEFDDTPNAERIRLQHRTGTYTEIRPDGTEVHKIVGEGYEITANNRYVLIKGVCNVTIEGDSYLNVKGDSYSNIMGNSYQVVKGNLDGLIQGDLNLTGEKDINITAGGTESLITLSTPDTVYIEGDLQVTGDIRTPGSVTAELNVTANKLFAVGGIETLGGINVGTTTSLPVLPTGVLKATTFINAPFILGTIVSDAIGTMQLMRILYNVHVHPAPEGTTGTPNPLML